jgi:hypothetical protein
VVVVDLFKGKWLRKVLALLRGQSSKPQALIDFNRETVLVGLHAGWPKLYERRIEDSWRLLMSQLERARNLYILDLSRLKVKDGDYSTYWKQIGRIEALEAFHTTVHTELSGLKKEQESEGKMKNNEEKIAGTKQRRKPKHGPAISL